MTAAPTTSATSTRITDSVSVWTRARRPSVTSTAPPSQPAATIACDRECTAGTNERETDALDELHFFSPPRRCMISFFACATTADGTPLDLLRLVRSFSRRNGSRRITSGTGVFGFRHNAYFVPYCFVNSRLAAI